MADHLPQPEAREAPPPPPPPPPPETIENQSVQESPPQTLELQIIEPPSSSDPQIEEWENRVRDWLSTMPKRRNVTVEEMEAWIATNQVPLPEQLKSAHRLELYQRVLPIHKRMRRPNQAEEGNSAVPKKARFQRTDQWIPVYAWLESLDRNEVVKSKEISDWLAENPSVKDTLFGRHSRYHLMHYVQKCHMKILKRRGKLPKVVKTPSPVSSVKVLSNAVMEISTTPAPLKAVPSVVMPSSMTKALPKVINNAVTASAAPLPSNPSSNLLNGNDAALAKQNEAFSKFELLTDLENHLTSLLSRQKQVSN